MAEHPLLSHIQSPKDLKQLKEPELRQLCSEVRETLIETVAETGGHLSSNLGIVEVTVAMHREFSTPKDQFVWDVGHQCYPHKLLTGRAEQFHTLRKEGGISGFPRPGESEHDAFIVGHSSTSISAANGMAKAKAMLGEDGYVVAVIGDGALTGGLAYEGLSNAGRSKDRLIVVLNDNGMSISQNVGFVARHLGGPPRPAALCAAQNPLQQCGCPDSGDWHAAQKQTAPLENRTEKNDVFQEQFF